MPEVEGLGERLEKLEGVVEATLQVLPPLVQDLSRRIDTLREEVKAELRETRTHTEGRLGSLEKRLGEVENKLEARLASTERRLAEGETRLESRMDQVQVRLEGQIQQVRQELEGRIAQ
ncbi:MAG: ATP-binding protein, partial [Thermus sp.]